MAFDIWLTLFFASLAISISPGAGAVVTMNSGLKYGLKKSYATIFGLQIGYLAQAFIVVIGLGSIIANSIILFEIVKWIGVAYLVFLGLSKILEKPKLVDDSKIEETYSSKQNFLQASFVNFTNIKATVFLVAFIPQFLDPNASLWIQFIIIGATLCLVDIVVMTGYATLASRLKFLIKNEKAMKIQNVITGVILIIAAIFVSSTQK